MRRDLIKRLEALEARRKPATMHEGLGHFYNVLSDEERAQAIAHIYPGDDHVYPSEAEHEAESA